jgi:hypothetical protein
MARSFHADYGRLVVISGDHILPNADSSLSIAIYRAPDCALCQNNSISMSTLIDWRTNTDRQTLSGLADEQTLI